MLAYVMMAVQVAGCICSHLGCVLFWLSIAEQQTFLILTESVGQEFGQNTIRMTCCFMIAGLLDETLKCLEVTPMSGD